MLIISSLTNEALIAFVAELPTNSGKESYKQPVKINYGSLFTTIYLTIKTASLSN